MLIHSGRNHRKTAKGFTLIEAMVSLAVIAIIVGIAIPNVGEWIGKARVRTGVEDLQNAIRIAQTEAAKRNQIVEFALTDTLPLPGENNIDNTPAVDNGTYWVVRAISATGTGKLFLQSGDLGSRGIKLNNAENESNSSLLFSGVGNVLTQINPDISLANTRVYRVVSSNDKYPMCVIATPGGGVRWCDSSNLAASHCPVDISC